MARNDVRVLRSIIEKRFSFADLAKRFEGVSNVTGNFFCPFHENSSTPAAKMYYNHERDMWVIYCFSERRHFTSYDYVDLIMCKKQGRYYSPREFLLERMGSLEFNTLYDNFLQKVSEYDEELYNTRAEYIQNVCSASENTVDFIEALYTERDIWVS